MGRKELVPIRSECKQGLTIPTRKALQVVELDASFRRSRSWIGSGIGADGRRFFAITLTDNRGAISGNEECRSGHLVVCCFCRLFRLGIGRDSGHGVFWEPPSRHPGRCRNAHLPGGAGPAFNFDWLYDAGAESGLGGGGAMIVVNAGAVGAASVPIPEMWPWPAPLTLLTLSAGCVLLSAPEHLAPRMRIGVVGVAFLGFLSVATLFSFRFFQARTDLAALRPLAGTWVAFEDGEKYLFTIGETGRIRGYRGSTWWLRGQMHQVNPHAQTVVFRSFGIDSYVDRGPFPMRVSAEAIQTQLPRLGACELRRITLGPRL